MTSPYLRTFLIISILFITFIGRAQTNKKNLLINFGPSSGYGYPTGLYRENSRIPALNLSADYSLNKLFSLGIYTAYTYSFYKVHFPPTPEIDYKDVWKGWDIGVRGIFHISPFIIKNEKIDLYMGPFFGYTNHSLVYDKKNIYRDSLNFKKDAVNAGGIFGFRYYITKNVGLYAEAGMARKFFMNGGVSFNLKLK
jgi:hypothetical protein